MAKKKGPTEDEGILELGFEYDATGEQAAVKGAENVSKAIEKTGKKAKNTSKELEGTSKALADSGESAKTTVKDMKDVDDSLKAITKSAKEATKAQQELGSSSVSASAAAKKGWDTRRKNADIKAKNTAMTTAADMKLDGYRYVESVTGKMNDDGLASRLTQIKTNIGLLEEYTSAQDKANASMLASLKTDKDKISSIDDNAQKISALNAKMKEVQATIDDTNSLVKKSDLLMSNATKSIESYTNVVDEETDVNASLKHSVADAVNEYDRMQKQLKLQEETQRNYVSSLKNYRDELLATEKVKKAAAKLENEQERIALLDQQNQRLAIAKAEFDAMSTAAEKYKNTLEAATRVGAKGYVPMATNVPYTPTGAELTSKLTDMGGNYAELKKVTDARQQSTAALIAEAAQFAKNAKEADSYEDKLKFTEMATEKLKEASLANKSALFDIGTLANQTGANLKTYTKYIQDNDTATLALKNGVVDLSNQLIDSRDGLRAQSKGITENITNLNTERKSIIENIKAQKELEKARLRTQASQNAMTQLQGVPAGIGGVTSNLVAQQGVNSNALADARGFLAAADATNVYEDKLENLNSAYNVINGAMKENKLAMASAKLTMEPLLAAYAEFKGDLDETDPKAKALKDTIEAMKKAYGDNMRAMREQGVEFESTRDSIVAEKKEWESLEKTARQASDKMRKKLEEDARKVKTSQDKVKSALHDTSMMMRTMGMTLSRYVTAPLVAAGFQAVKFTAQMEMNIKSLEILLGNNARAAEELYAQVTHYAAKTPYEIPDLTAATKQLLAFGSASGDVMKELQMLGDLAQNDAEKLASVTSAFGKVQARGVAHMRELNRFIMAGVPIIETLGTVMNQSSDELFKSVEQGQVSFDAIKQSIELLTSEGGRFFDMSEKLSQTVKGRWSTLSDEVNLALKSFADDYMDTILSIINKTIALAEAIQALTPGQRAVIRNWAIAAAAIGPVLLGVSKVVAMWRNLYDLISKTKIATSLVGAATGGIIAGVVALIALIGGALYMKTKKITEEFNEQRDAVSKIFDENSGIFKSGASDELYETVSATIIKTLNLSLSIKDVMAILKSETKDTAAEVLISLNAAKVENTKNLNAMQKEYDALLSRVKSRHLPSQYDPSQWFKKAPSEYFKQRGDSASLQMLDDLAKLNMAMDKLRAEYAETEKEITQGKGLVNFLKRQLNMTSAAATNISTLLESFKINTEEAINGTIAQFERFAGVAPLADNAVQALSDIMESGIISFTNPEEIQAYLEANGIGKSSAARTIFAYLLNPTDETMQEAAAGLKEFFQGVGRYTIEAANEYIEAAKNTFKSENIADILLAGSSTGSLDLIKGQADVMAKTYTEIVSSSVKTLMQDNLGMTFEQALEQAERLYPEFFAELRKALKTSEGLKAAEELQKTAKSYTTQLSQIGMNEMQKFNSEVDALYAQLSESEYAERFKNSLDIIKYAYNQVEFSKATDELTQQRNELTMSADAYKELTYRLQGYDAAQVKSLMTMYKFNEALASLKSLSYTALTSYGTDFGQAAKDLKSIKPMPSADLNLARKFTIPLAAPGALTSEQSGEASSVRQSAINALIESYLRMDEVTQQLTVSSQGYKDFIAAITKEELNAATATGLLNIANEALIDNTTQIATFGKDANEVQLAFWQNIKDSRTWSDTESAALQALIDSYKKLIELGADVEKAGTAFEDAYAGIREEIDAFGRSASQQRGAEVLAKQTELLKAIADDTKMSYEDVLRAFVEGAMDTELAARFKRVTDVTEAFGKYLKDKALADIEKTSADYAKQVAQLGMSDDEKIIDNFKRAYTDAGIAVDEFAVAVLAANLKTINTSEIIKDVSKEVENYAKQTAQLGMSEMGKAIDNIERQGKAAKWTSEQIQEVTDSARKYYALQASMEARKTTAKKAEDFDSLIAQKTMEGLLAGRDDMTVWLMQNAETIGTNADLAISTYKVAKARIDAANAQESLTDTFDDYAKQAAQLGMSEREILEDNLRRTIALAELVEGTDEYNSAMLLLKKTLESFDKIKADEVLNDIDDAISEYQKKTSQLGMSDRSIAIFDALEDNKDASPAKIKELTDAINKYYDAVEAGEREVKKQDAKEAYSSLIDSLKDEAAAVNASPWQKFVLDNSKAIWDWAIASGDANKAFEDLKKQFDDTQAIKDADAALKALADVTKDYGSRLSMLGATEYEQAIHAIYTTGIAAQWTAEQFKEASDAVKAYFDGVASQNWTDLTGEIGTVSDVYFRNPRQDMYDNIEKTGLDAGKSIEERQAAKDLYDQIENAKVLKGVLDSIANTAFDALITDLERVGETLSEGATWGEAFEDTIGNIVGALINALPQLLMSAGLQLITAGQWHIGLPLIAAAGAAAILKGYVKGETSGNKDGTTTPSNLNFSAKGDSFDRGRILNVPTVFNTASGLNIGGELGTEAILPLSRDSNGRLGVNVAGSGGGNTIAVPVTVNIVNQSGVETEAEVSETTNADGGKNIEVIIKRIVNNGMANGEYDRTMKSRYGLNNRGVS